MVVKFPWKICNKAVAKNHHAVQCDHCQLWVHFRCNKINLQTYKFLQKSSFAWYCIKCFGRYYSFSTISDNELSQTSEGKKIKFKVLTKKNILANHDLRVTFCKIQPTLDIQCLKFSWFSLILVHIWSSTSVQFSFWFWFVDLDLQTSKIQAVS